MAEKVQLRYNYIFYLLLRTAILNAKYLRPIKQEYLQKV
jgi:hypothetical protein